MKTNGENGTTENETETKTESEPLKSEEKPTHSSKTEPTHSPTTQASLLASMAEAQNGLENKSNLISETIKNFGLDRFTGRFQMNRTLFWIFGVIWGHCVFKIGCIRGVIRKFNINRALSCLKLKFSKNTIQKYFWNRSTSTVHDLRFRPPSGLSWLTVKN